MTNLEIMTALEKILLEQKEQFEKFMNEMKEIERVKERPYLVIQNCEANSETKELKIILRNKGNGIAFCVNPACECFEKVNSDDKKICLERANAIEDTVVMVGEFLETFWKIEMENVVGELVIKYKDASDRSYEQIFEFTIDEKLEITSRAYAVPKLLKS